MQTHTVVLREPILRPFEEVDRWMERGWVGKKEEEVDEKGAERPAEQKKYLEKEERVSFQGHAAADRNV